MSDIDISKDFSPEIRTVVFNHNFEGYSVEVTFKEDVTEIAEIDLNHKHTVIATLTANGFDEMIAKCILKNREEMRKS